MRTTTYRLSVCTLLSAGILAACGGVPEAELSPSEEPLGTREAALCSGLSVSSLTSVGVDSYEGEVAGNGSWAVSLFANAIRLEYYIDGILRSYDERPGNSGYWYFSQGGISCGTHSVEVRAFPMVIDSNGNETTCVSAQTSWTASFTDTSCMCVINGLTYRNGRKNPANNCLICDTSRSRTSWSFNPAGYVDTRGYCKSLTDGRRICANAGIKSGLSCTTNSDCYIFCGALE